MAYRLTIKSVTGKILTFHSVDSYEVIDGFVTFIDSKNGETKRFAFPNCEIEVER